jgi:two-component system NtrC family sensor kinase
VQINQTLEETLALRDYDLRMSNIRVHLDFAPGLPVTAADPHQLQQVFLNMVNNAVDAILERSTDGDLWVRTGTQGDDRLFIEITDSGPGVHDASRVFDPFYTTKPVGKGTGLGLSICYGIITEHGGTIRVRNVPTRGASFTIELPVQSVAATLPAKTSPTAVPGRDRRILLVDHDESVLEAVSTILRGRDHRVHTATGITEAIALMEQQEFDLIIADLQISEGPDGEGFGDWMAKHKPALSHNLIWMSAVTPPRGAGQKFTGNSGQILQKPFKASDLIAAVDELVLAKVHAAPVQP